MYGEDPNLASSNVSKIIFLRVYYALMLTCFVHFYMTVLSSDHTLTRIT